MKQIIVKDSHLYLIRKMEMFTQQSLHAASSIQKTTCMKYFIISCLMLVLLAFAVPGKKLSGKITDENGKPLVGALISIIGSKTAVTTDSSGNYVLALPEGEIKLVITYIGYEKREVELKRQSVMNISLKPSTEALDEVVVIGYGTQKKVSITGSVASISNIIGYDATPFPVALAGSVAGVEVKGKRLNKQNVTGNKVKNESWRYNNNFNREGYDAITENQFLKVKDNPLSTFSIDVDAASYSNIRRMINQGQIPPQGAVRIEEMINYFSYQYPQPKADVPFSVNTEISTCPWNHQHQLVLIGLQGKKIDVEQLPASNLTFLIDVSGSMWEPDKLPLVKASLKLLVDQLRPQDKVAIVVYAGNAGLVLPSTYGNEKTKIKEAIERLEAGGSTAGGDGIQLAYKVAQENFVTKGNNRIILCTDGDFNVGVSSDDALERLIEKERETGIYLTVLGYGQGNYQDAKMQKLADKGNGNHSYIDGIGEAKKVLVHEFGGTLFTIAKDVKLQIEFNSAKIKGYRLIGYEKRILAKEDFNNDKKDAGDLGSGHTVTALYEIIPNGKESPELDSVDALKYQQPVKRRSFKNYNEEILTIKLRYKQPDGDKSKLLEVVLRGNQVEFNKTSNNFRFAAAVAAYGMLLRNSAYKGNADYNFVKRIAMNAMGNDTEGYRKEFVNMVDNTMMITGKPNDEVMNIR
jgi:Ca-activated chloride channel family protein